MNSVPLCTVINTATVKEQMILHVISSTINHTRFLLKFACYYYWKWRRHFTIKANSFYRTSVVPIANERLYCQTV